MITFLRQRTGDEESRERLFLPRMVKPAAQSTELFRACRVFIVAEKQHGLRVWVPASLPSSRKQGIGSQTQRWCCAGHGRRACPDCRWLSSRLQHSGGGLHRSYWLRHRTFLLGFLKCFVNSAHNFPSLGNSGSGCFKRSARLDSVFSASTKSNLSAGGGGAAGSVA